MIYQAIYFLDIIWKLSEIYLFSLPRTSKSILYLSLSPDRMLLSQVLDNIWSPIHTNPVHPDLHLGASLLDSNLFCCCSWASPLLLLLLFKWMALFLFPDENPIVTAVLIKSHICLLQEVAGKSQGPTSNNVSGSSGAQLQSRKSTQETWLLIYQRAGCTCH